MEQADLVTDLVEWGSWFCFGLGGLVLLVGAFGMIRLPDFWARLHAAGMIDTLGAALMLLGMMLQAGLALATLKLALIGLLLFLTGPTATHAIANAAWVAGIKPLRMVKDESGRLGEKVSS